MDNEKAIWRPPPHPCLVSSKEQTFFIPSNRPTGYTVVSKAHLLSLDDPRLSPLWSAVFLLLSCSASGSAVAAVASLPRFFVSSSKATDHQQLPDLASYPGKPVHMELGRVSRKQKRKRPLHSNSLVCCISFDYRGMGSSDYSLMKRTKNEGESKLTYARERWLDCTSVVPLFSLGNALISHKIERFALDVAYHLCGSRWNGTNG